MRWIGCKGCWHVAASITHLTVVMQQVANRVQAARFCDARFQPCSHSS